MAAVDMNMNGTVDEYSHSEADLAQITELVIMPYILPTLTVRELTQLNCTSWRFWGASIVKLIAKVRRENNNNDWYFPVFFPDLLETTLLTNSTTRSKWFGIHHLSGTEVHLRPRPLPPLDYLPPTWITSLHTHAIAGSGGLLLLRMSPCACTPTSMLESRWERLMVINPLTKKWRELPAAECGSRKWDSDGMHALMVVDDVQNSYKILLASPDYVCVYKSTSNNWEYRHFRVCGRWTWSNRRMYSEWGYLCASAYVGGHLYFADIKLEHQAFVVVRLFEIHEEAGTWIFQKGFSIRRQDFQRRASMPMTPVENRMQIDRRLRIVECMGDMYAIIPVMFPSDEQGAIETVDGLEVMPLQFQIHLLQGDGLCHGILVIQVPQSADDMLLRREKILRLSNSGFDGGRFRCTARGNVIWVHLEDYLLQYDIVSRQSTTHLIPSTLRFEELLGFAYTPSFHMKP